MYIIIQYVQHTVKPPIVDPPRKGHCIINLSTEDDSSWDQKILFSEMTQFIIDTIINSHLNLLTSTSQDTIAPKILLTSTGLKITAACIHKSIYHGNWASNDHSPLRKKGRIMCRQITA